MTQSVELLIGQLLDEPTSDSVIMEIGRKSNLQARLERALLRTAVDSTTFHSVFGVSRSQLIGISHTAYIRIRDPLPGLWRQRLLRGFLGFFCFTLDLLEENSLAHLQNDFDEAKDEAVGFNRKEFREKIFDDPDVRAYFESLYKPQNTSESETPTTEIARMTKGWNGLDFQSIEFHRRGTTSFILHGRSNSLNQRIALKCLIYPYTRFAPIADEASHYYERYNAANPRFVVKVHSSSSKWILMDFVEGLTLADFATQIFGGSDAKESAREIDLELIRVIGSSLLEALEEMDSYGWKHLDLTPSNIIVRGRRKAPDRISAVDSLVLVDIGRNHLYSRSISLLEGPEAIFVAPEVKGEKRNYEYSDLYSLALIFIWLANRQNLIFPVVSDNIYQEAAPLGRLLEDMIDENPSNRFLLIDFDPDSGERYGRLKQILEDGLRVLESAQKVSPSDEKWIRSLLDLYRSRHPQQQWRIWRDSRHSSDKLMAHSGWLLAWSVVCAANWYMISILVFFVGIALLGCGQLSCFD